jgi:hypothetical protein
MENLKTQLRAHSVRLLERWQGPLESFTQACTNLAALMALALLGSAYAVLPAIEVFGHDEVHYYSAPEFWFKLGEDGRWLNYFLHDFLRSLPLWTWVALLLVTTGTLLFHLARSLGFSPAQAALPAAAILLAPPFVEQSLWPATTIPAIVVLLLAQTLIARGVAEWRVYLFAGVLGFGTLQSFYFLMPLLYLGRFLAVPAGAKPWLLFVRHMIWWVLGAVAGVLVMSVILWLWTGRFGVQPAEWRQTQPVRDAGGLVRNILYVLDAFRVQTALLLQQAGADKRWFGLAVLALLAVRARSLPGVLPAGLMLVAVAASFFAFSVPLAPIIQSRSLVALAAAFVLALALLPGKAAGARLIGMLLLLMVSYCFSLSGHAYLTKHREDTAFFYYKLQQALPAPPRSYAAVALFGSMPPGTAHAFVFNDASLMRGVMSALGVPAYWDCRQGTDERCQGLAGLPAQATQLLAGGQLAITVTSDNVAVLNYQE